MPSCFIKNCFFLSLKTDAHLDLVVPNEGFKFLILISSWVLCAFLKQTLLALTSRSIYTAREVNCRLAYGNLIKLFDSDYKFG